MTALLAWTTLLGSSAGALWLSGLSLRRLFRGRWLSALPAGLGALALVATALAIGSLLGTLHTWNRLAWEAPVARLHFTSEGGGRYRVRLETADGRIRSLPLRGDEWQLDARVLRWRPLANLLGADALYRLERLSGRYHDLSRAARLPPSLHRLEGGTLPPWPWRPMEGWLRRVASRHGSATYMPMADGARFEVRITQSGLVALPLNESAEEAMERW